MLLVWLGDGVCVWLAVVVAVSDMEGLPDGDGVPVALALEDCVDVSEPDCVALGVLVSDGLPEEDGVNEVLGVHVRLAVTDAVDVGDGDSVALILNVGVCDGEGVREMRSRSSLGEDTAASSTRLGARPRGRQGRRACVAAGAGARARRCRQAGHVSKCFSGAEQGGARAAGAIRAHTGWGMQESEHMWRRGGRVLATGLQHEPAHDRRRCV